MNAQFWWGFLSGVAATVLAAAVVLFALFVRSAKRGWWEGR